MQYRSEKMNFVARGADLFWPNWQIDWSGVEFGSTFGVCAVEFPAENLFSRNRTYFKQF